MLTIDPRIGSKHLLRPLRSCGVPCRFAPLEFGDCAFTARGRKGKLLRVGVELKRAADLFSSLSTKRLVGHQLPGLIRSYDIRWLLVEGAFGPDREGGIRSPLDSLTTSWSYDTFAKHMATLAVRGGLHLWRTCTTTETIAFLAALYRWGQRKDLDEHTAHLGFVEEYVDPVLRFRPSLRWLVAKELPGLGRKKSRHAANTFCCVHKMVGATEEQWQELRGVGGKLAARLYSSIRCERCRKQHRHQNTPVSSATHLKKSS